MEEKKMLKEEELALANTILNELRQNNDKFGIAYLQIRYHLSFGSASRIVDYFLKNGYAEAGQFGSVILEKSDGAIVECQLNYRISDSGLNKGHYNISFNDDNTVMYIQRIVEENQDKWKIKTLYAQKSN